MNVSMEGSIDEEEGSEKVEKEALDTTIHQPDFVTEVNKRYYFLFSDFVTEVNKKATALCLFLSQG